MADFKFAPSHREAALHYNDVYHWLGASLESALKSHPSNIIMYKANNATYYLNVLCVCAYTNATIAKHTEQVWNRIIILRTNNSISNHGWF